VDFRYSEEQLSLQDTLQRFISRDYDFERRRAFARSPLGFSSEAWDRYAELGLLALPFPEEFGGLGGGSVDVMAVMEAVGRGLLLEPYLTTVVLSGGVLRDAAPHAIKRAMLPQIAAGQLRIALAAYESAGRYDLSHVACTAVRRGEGWVLSGRKAVVLDAPSADHFLVSARTGGAVNDPSGISLYLVPRDATGLALLGYPTQSGARAGDLTLTDVAVGAEWLIGTQGQALGVLERGVDGAIAALCAEALGIMTALNEATLDYLKTRKQFGMPIGAFQALQHRMAEMIIAAEQARSMAIIAAVHAGDADAAKRRRAISGAKAYVGQAARFVGQQAVQLHGGMGMVDDVVVSHYFKRLTMIDMSLGDADFHLTRFAESPETDP
jgi:alkylation response protein AidB-like acyl-CoA dehydrogenase